MSGVPSVDDIRDSLGGEVRQRRSPWPVVAIVVAVLIAGVIYFRKPITPDPEPSPVVTDVDAMVAECTRQYITMLADGQEVLAGEVKAGSVGDQEQYFNRSVTISSAARERAFMPLARLENEVIPEGNWGDAESEAVAEHLSRVVAGMREALK